MPDLPSVPSTGKDPWLRPELVAPWWKIIYIIGVMLGVGIILGAVYSTRHPSGAFYQRFSDYYFLRNAAFESGFLALFLFFLYYRDWKLSDFRLHIGWWTSLCGIGLFLLTMLGVYLVNHTTNVLFHHFRGTALGDCLALFVPKRPNIALHSVPLYWVTIVAVTLLNAFYEELVYMGYVFNQWAQKFGAGKALAFTSFLRLIVHTYQGTEQLLPIALWSLLFGVWYRYQGKLWPLILAHFLIDLLSLGLFKLNYGAPN